MQERKKNSSSRGGTAVHLMRLGRTGGIPRSKEKFFSADESRTPEQRQIMNCRPGSADS